MDSVIIFFDNVNKEGFIIKFMTPPGIKRAIVVIDFNEGDKEEKRKIKTPSLPLPN